MKNIVTEAKKNYLKLSKPRSCNLSFYVNYWVKETNLRNYVSKKIQKISPGSDFKNNNDLSSAVKEYFSILSIDEMNYLHREIMSVFPYSKRVQTAEKNKSLFHRLEKSFIKLTLARNKLAIDQGYSNYVDLIVNHDKLPKNSYQKFIKKIDLVISLINNKLPKSANFPNWFYSSLNIPCFICQMPFPDLKRQEIIKLTEEKYSILKKFKNKISIFFGDNAQTTYHKETNTFKIMLLKDTNKRHRIIDFIHELGHIIYWLESFKNNKNPLELGRYKAEKFAVEVEVKILEEIFPSVLESKFGDILLMFWRILFEIHIYENPKKSSPKLYSQLFNRCFLEAHQTNNWLYLVDERIVSKPLSSLSQTIAYFEALFNNYVKNSK